MSAKAAVTAGLVPMRGRRQKRRLNYGPKQDFITGFNGPDVEILPIPFGTDEFLLPGMQPGVSGALLGLDVRAKGMGTLSDPALEFACGGFTDVQFVDPGAYGTRFFNVTRLLAACGANSRVKLRGQWLAWNGNSARLHLCRETLSQEDSVLVVAPHPDDAEMAAYGLYSSMKATVVTLTAGDASKRFQNPGVFPALGRALIAKLRVWDSITIPRLGGVEMENAVNLCYPDGKLSEMRERPARDFQASGEEPLDFDGLRRLNSSSLISARSGCTWHSLIADLEQILVQTQPTIIVTPHPGLDPHADHIAATAAAVAAMKMAGLRKGRFFYTCVHNRCSELWPFGPLGSGVAHLLVTSASGEQASRFYSHTLSPRTQLEKFMALEAMHDVRDIAWPERPSLRKAAKRFGREFKALRSGPRPQNYVRRAVRPDEPFFVSDFQSALVPPGPGQAWETAE